MSSRHALLPFALACVLLPSSAQAGRPLASDDASTAEHGTCQVETWFERSGNDHALVTAPACGVADGMEVGLDYTRPHPRDPVRASAGLALKWVPEGGKMSPPLGELTFGLKMAATYDHPSDAGWRRAERSVLALATLQARDSVTAHVNLGAAREHEGGSTASLLNLAIVWSPHDRTVLFAERQMNDKRSVFGGAVNTVGARWWLAKDRWGLDLTTSHQSGVGSASWTLGLGWYGVSL